MHGGTQTTSPSANLAISVGHSQSHHRGRHLSFNRLSRSTCFIVQTNKTYVHDVHSRSTYTATRRRRASSAHLLATVPATISLGHSRPNQRGRRLSLTRLSRPTPRTSRHAVHRRHHFSTYIGIILRLSGHHFSTYIGIIFLGIIFLTYIIFHLPSATSCRHHLRQPRAAITFGNTLLSNQPPLWHLAPRQLPSRRSPPCNHPPFSVASCTPAAPIPAVNKNL